MSDDDTVKPRPARAADEHRAYAFFQRGRSFLARGHPGQAALYLERAKRLEPEKNSIREALARAYFGLGRYEEAAAEFGVIVARVPTNDYALFGLARSLMKLGRHGDARAHLRLACAMAPDKAEYRAALEACLAGCGDD